MTNNDFKTIISSKHKLFDLHLKETFKYRDLIALFVKRDVVATYKQTALGPLWAIIQPLLTTIVFTVIFNKIAGLTTADTIGNFEMPAFVFYMAGNIIWSYFSANLTRTSNTFINNRAIMGKVYYPRLVTPIATSCSYLISFGIQFVLLAAFWLYYIIRGGTSITVTPMLLLIPLCILQMMILSTGCGIIISSLTTKYRDLSLLVTFGVELWRYASPIAYGLALVPEKWMWLYMLNPVASMVTTFRYACFGFGYFNLKYYLISWASSLVVFFVGLLIFSKIEKNFMDTV